MLLARDFSRRKQPQNATWSSRLFPPSEFADGAVADDDDDDKQEAAANDRLARVRQRSSTTSSIRPTLSRRIYAAANAHPRRNVARARRQVRLHGCQKNALALGNGAMINCTDRGLPRCHNSPLEIAGRERDPTGILYELFRYRFLSPCHTFRQRDETSEIARGN